MAMGEEHETYEEYQERAYQTLEEIEARIVARLDELKRAGNTPFGEWLACSQALLQVQQTHLLHGVFDILRGWDEHGVPVYPMAT
jgi:hypothetical protein